MATVNETPRTQMRTMTAPESPIASGFSSAPWPQWQRIAFRFVFSYLAVYCLPFPVGVVNWGNQGLVPGTSFLLQAYYRPLRAFVPWVGTHILHIARPIVYDSNGG